MRGKGNRGRGYRRVVVATALGLVVGFGLFAPGAGATGTVGPIRLAGGGSHWKALVGYNLPLITSGQRVHGRIGISWRTGRWSAGWKFIAHAGPPRRGDQRRFYRFVQGIPVPKAVARAALRNPRSTRVDMNVDYDLPTADSNDLDSDGFKSGQGGIGRAGIAFCETHRAIVISPSSSKAHRIVPPTCGGNLTWRLGEKPDKGLVRKRGNSLLYQPNGSAGADEVVLEGYRQQRLIVRQRIPVRLVEGTPSKISVVAFGDSVTAGFGYFGATGKQMGITQLDACRPGATVFNDACSSNSYNRNSSAGSKPDYLPDYGLSRNISWPAQWANQYGITNYANYAVTGSAPSDWLPGGQFNSTLQSIENQNPDYILLTMGANPLLSDVLFGIDNMGCALESDLFGDFRQCVLDAFAAVDLNQKLNQLYTSLVNNTSSRIVVMQYHLAVPSTALAYTAVQLEAMTEILDGVIAEEAASVSSSRITVVSPPRFDVGIDMSPLYPSDYSCSFLGYKVDGPSVQATISQDELEFDHPLSFCSGPAIGSPWIISGDTGIHPSAAGYLQMSSQVPAPGS